MQLFSGLKLSELFCGTKSLHHLPPVPLAPSIPLDPPTLFQMFVIRKGFGYNYLFRIGQLYLEHNVLQPLGHLHLLC